MTVTFCDYLEPCEVYDHLFAAFTEWEEEDTHFYVRYRKCKRCSLVEKWGKYKWMGEKCYERYYQKEESIE